MSEQFENETVIITLEWTVQNGAFHGISVDPQDLVDSVYTGPTTIQLIVSYNTLYNVSAVATLCGQNSSHFLELHYGESESL